MDRQVKAMNNEISYNDVALFDNIKEADLDKLLVCIRSFKKEFKKGQTIYMETDNIPYVGIVWRKLCGSERCFFLGDI